MIGKKNSNQISFEFQFDCSDYHYYLLNYESKDNFLMNSSFFQLILSIWGTFLICKISSERFSDV